MAGVEDGSVIVFCPLVQAVAAGFAVSHLYPEGTEKLQVMEKGSGLREGSQELSHPVSHFVAGCGLPVMRWA